MVNFPCPKKPDHKHDTKSWQKPKSKSKSDHNCR
jgi:hypothetical protein